MRLLDLYSGTGSVAKAARELGFIVTTLDKENISGSKADIITDIFDWDYMAHPFPPGYFDVIWASPPCTTFSAAKRKNIGRNGCTAETIAEDIENIGVPLLRKTLDILDYLRPTYYFIENPQTGRMKEYLDLPYYDVDYCMYGFQYRKRTRIWTNLSEFNPKLCNGRCGSYVNKKHIAQVNTKGGGGNRLPRYAVPHPLLTEILDLAQKKVLKIDV